jgi:type VI secretion system secreted protein VgrG
MAISTKTTITIDGKTMTRFTELSIHQNANAHHSFSVIQPVPKEFVGEAVEKSQDYIGKTIKIEIKSSHMTTDAPFVFNGIITQANLKRVNGSTGAIHINGYSPTIALESLPNTKSYTNKSLSDISQEIFGNYTQVQLRPTVNLKNNPMLPFTVQYNESDFGFLRRMAQKKGEWFYFNGEELIFGKPKSNTFNLEYGRSLHSFDIEMNAKPLGFEYTGYDSSNAETQMANSNEINYQPTGYSKQVYDASKKIFPNTSNSLYTNPLDEGNSRSHLIDRVTTQMQSMAASLVTAKGDSDETGLRIGDVVIINESAFSMTGNPKDGVKEQNYGSYIITSLSHTCEEAGQYKNRFVAVPESALAAPYGDVYAIPTATTQPAKVTDNNDPAGLGRVQVQMEWQKNNSENTPWIRMTNPHAGGGKGMYFIPEIGEEVLVGFEGGNAEKPYVLGAMYNGSESSSYSTAGNDQKVIQTRSGTKIIMNDAIGSVFIEDPSGNTVLLDGKGNISMNAPKNMTINVGENLDISVGKNMTTSVGKNMDTQVGEDKSTTVNKKNSLQAKEYKQNVDENKTMTVGGDLKETTGTTTHKATSGDILIQSSGISKMLGAIDAKVNKG